MSLLPFNTAFNGLTVLLFALFGGSPGPCLCVYLCVCLSQCKNNAWLRVSV